MLSRLGSGIPWLVLRYSSFFLFPIPFLASQIFAIQGASPAEIAFSIAAAAFLASLAFGVVAIAGKRSGGATFFVSRASFGVSANNLPLLLVVISRVLLAVGLLFALSGLVTQYLQNQNLAAVSVVVVAFGAGWLSIANKNLETAGAICLVALFLIAASLSFSFQSEIGPQTVRGLPMLSSVSILFSFFALLLGTAAADDSERLDHRVRGWKIVLAITLSSTISATLGANFFAQVVFSAPIMQFATLISLVFIFVLNQKSLLKQLSTAMPRIPSSIALPVVGFLQAIAVFVFFNNFALDISLIRDLVKLALVPAIAFVGIISSETLIRRVAFHDVSLAHSYGLYRPLNPWNLAGFIVSMFIAMALTPMERLTFPVFGLLIELAPQPIFWRYSNFGLAMGFVCAFLVPVIFGIRRIRKQESAVLEIERRKTLLQDSEIGVLND